MRESWTGSGKLHLNSRSYHRSGPQAPSLSPTKHLRDAQALGRRISRGKGLEDFRGRVVLERTILLLWVLERVSRTHV